MHYHLEVILPDTGNLDRDIKNILAPFSENAEEDVKNSHTLYDWYSIGGRWSGAKKKSNATQEQLDTFYNLLVEKKVTVSSLVFGKQTLEPPEQKDFVDELWRQTCPDCGDICPIFSHSGDNDGNDVCLVGNIPSRLKSSTLIIAGWNHENKVLEAKYLAIDEMYNGINWVKTEYTGNVKDELEKYQKKCQEMYNEQWNEKNNPGITWLCVTIDYHS